MVKVKEGDLVKIEYTGSLASNGQVFETTDEKIAREAGIFEQSAKYGPKLAIYGHKSIMKGVEKAIEASQQGKKEDFAIEPGDAFGPRQSELVRMIPQKDFQKQSIEPYPGLMLNLDGAMARVKSVTSGRVVVDFNHPLAGERVLYTLKVHEVITDDTQKAAAILDSLGIKGEIKTAKEGLKVELPPSVSKADFDAIKHAVEVAIPGAKVEGKA